MSPKSECLKITKAMVTNAANAVVQEQSSFTAVLGANWCSRFGNQYRGSINN